jgi:hypothetical protein
MAMLACFVGAIVTTFSNDNKSVVCLANASESLENLGNAAPVPFESIPPQEPSFWENCESTIVNRTLPITIRNCESHNGESIQVVINGSLEAEFLRQDAQDFRDWLTACDRGICPKTAYNDDNCPKISWFRANYLCFDHIDRIRYIMLGKLQFPSLDSRDIIAYLTR